MKRWKNAFLFAFGFCVYITIEVLFRGYSFPICGVMGGLAILSLDKVNDSFGWDLDLSLQCLYGALIITFEEYYIGEFALVTKFFPVMWDYSNMPLNIDGVICLPFSVAWIFVSAFAIFCADAINYYFFRATERPRYVLLGKIRFSMPEMEV